MRDHRRSHDPKPRQRSVTAPHPGDH